VANIFQRIGNLFKAPIIGKRDLTDDAQQLSNGMSTSQFGAGEPLPPQPLGGDPRQWQYRPSINITPPQSDRRVDPAVLRQLARSYDLLARCLSRRKEELRTLHWSIQPKERRNKKKMREIQEKYAKEIKMVDDFFRHPEGYMEKVNGKWVRMPITDYQSWVNAILDDMFVIDAIAIYPRRKLNGEMLSLERIAGETIKVLLDDSGRLPHPPLPAYQQWLYGRPNAEYKANELIYRTYNPSNDSPYGMSVVEQIVAHVQMAMRNEAFISSYFSEGAIPPLLFTVPESWSVDQMLEFADIMNARLSGNAKALREFNIVPHGTQKLELKPFDYNEKWVNYVATMTCVLCGVQPHEMGIVPQTSGLGGKSFGEAASYIHDKQTMFVSEFLQSLFNDIIRFHFGFDEICFVFDHLLEKEERERAEINEILIKTGQKSIDQILVENGEEPEGINRFYQANDRLYGLPDLLALSQYGSVAVNLGQIGGIKMPDDTFTEDVQITQNADNPDVKTPNPNQAKDPSAKLDTSHTEAPDENKHKPPQPPKQPEGTHYPRSETVNTVKSTVADLTKDTDDDDEDDVNDDVSSPGAAEEKRDTHELELIFIATYYSLFRKVKYSPHMTNPSSVLGAFALTHSQQQELADALYKLKRDTYIESYNKYAREHGLESIETLDHQTEAKIRHAVRDSVDSIVSTYQSDLRRAYETLIDAGITDPSELVDRLNSWRVNRNRWKGEQIATTEVSKPWNDAVLSVDKSLGITDEREYYVTPDSCVCAKCAAMVAGNPYTYDAAMSLPIPNHPHCVHFIQSRPKK
jgi:hypothetical protein